MGSTCTTLETLQSELADGIGNSRVPQRGQHSPSGTVALAQGIRGQEILRHTVAEFYEERANHVVRAVLE